MAVDQRIVEPGSGGVGWVVLDGHRMPLARVSTQREAVDFAAAQLRTLPGGGHVTIFRADGRVEGQHTIHSASPGLLRVPGPLNQPEPRVGDTIGVISADGKRVNKGLGALDWILAILAVVGAPVSAFMNTALQEAAGNGWVAFTFATFTFTVGCAGAVIAMRSGLQSYGLLAAVSACYVVALLIASAIGRGVLDVEPVTGAGPFNLLASFVASAFNAYGPLGFFVSVVIGSWLGYRLSAHLPKASAH